MKKFIAGLFVTLCIALLVGTVWAKSVTVILCDQCDKQMTPDDYYKVEHVMKCDNDPGEWHLCSTGCLAKWAKNHKVPSSDRGTIIFSVDDDYTILHSGTGMNNDIGHAPPHNLEAEQSVLGAMLFDQRAIAQVLEAKVVIEDFYVEAHRQIFKAILSLYKESTPIDSITVSEALCKQGALKMAGGATYLSELLDVTPTVVHVDFWVRIVKEKATLRALHDAAIETIADINNSTLDTEDVLDSAERRTFKVTEKRISQSMRPTSIIVPAISEWLEDLRDNPRAITGLSTGYTDLDRLMRGMQKQDLIIIAGRPSMGKTSLAMNIAQNVAIREQGVVAIFSLEMGEQQIVIRMICSEAKTKDLTLDWLQTGYAPRHLVPHIHDAQDAIAKANIHIDDSAGVTAMEIRAKSRLLKVKGGLDLVVVDYLQLMEERRKRESNREQDVASISRHLKGLAKELDVPVIALSQLSRRTEYRESQRPQLADLRESGAIEQDADVVLMLYREEYYERLKNPKAEILDKILNKAEVIIAKQRNGPTGIVNLNFFGERVRFDNRKE